MWGWLDRRVEVKVEGGVGLKALDETERGKWGERGKMSPRYQIMNR